MRDDGVDLADGLIDVSEMSLQQLDELDESSLARALRRIFVSHDTEQCLAVSSFNSVIEDGLIDLNESHRPRTG